jgi:hypothetical protein
MQLAFTLIGDDTDVSTALGEVTTQGAAVTESTGSFTPDLIIFTTNRGGSGTATQGITNPDAAFSIGMATRDPNSDAVTQSSLNHLFRNKPLPPTEVSAITSYDSVVRSISSTMELGGMQVTGFGAASFGVDKVPGLSGGVRANYLAIGFNGNIEVKHLQTQVPASGVSTIEEFEGWEFAPTVSILAWSSLALADTFSTDQYGGSFSLGIAGPTSGTSDKAGTNHTFGDGLVTTDTGVEIDPYYSIHLRSHLGSSPLHRSRPTSYFGGMYRIAWSRSNLTYVGFLVTLGPHGSLPVQAQVIDDAGFLDPTDWGKYANIGIIMPTAFPQERTPPYVDHEQGSYIPVVMVTLDFIDYSEVYTHQVEEDQVVGVLRVESGIPYNAIAVSAQEVLPATINGTDTFWTPDASEDQLMLAEFMAPVNQVPYGPASVLNSLNRTIDTLIDSSEVFLHTAVTDQEVLPDFIDETETLTPAADPDYVVEPWFIDYWWIAVPDVTSSTVAYPGYPNHSEVYVPAAVSAQEVEPSFIDETVQYTHAADSDQVVAPSFLDETAQYTHAADIKISIFPGFIDGSEAYEQAAITNLVAAPDFLSPGSSVNSPAAVTVVGGVSTNADLTRLDKKIQVILAKVLRRRQ